MKLWNTTIPYYDETVDFIPQITPYIKEGSKCAIVVCPGGGYTWRAPHEGGTIAEWLNTIGVSAFVLDYRVAPYKAPAEGSDVQRAMRVARAEAEKYGIEYVGVMGFSAGGHLAGTASVHYDKHFYDKTDAIDEYTARPDFSVLCYAVLDFYEFRHDGTRSNLIGSNPKVADKEFYAIPKQITDDTPPAFLWHTSEDAAVPAENSMLYAMGLNAHQIPYEMHIYPFGRHGLGLAPEFPHVAQWAPALDKWLSEMNFK